MEYYYKYPRPAVTVDCVVFAIDFIESNLKVLLIKRGTAPFENKWAIPGGFVQINEALDEAAIRELKEETGLESVYLEQLYTYGDITRDPRERVISVAHFALVNIEGKLLSAQTDAIDAAWFSLTELPSLAFDHEKIISDAVERLRGKLAYRPIGFELLPDLFTLSQLQKLYEIILDTSIDKRNFRKKLQNLDVLIETDEIEKDVSHRAARLYRFDREKYIAMEKNGFYFELRA